MVEPLDVRLVCCILHRKRLTAGLRQLSSGEKLEFIAENTEAVKKQIQEVLKTENCKIIDAVDENGTTRMIVQKI
ncbi:MAG: sulfurtransferase TusA family protein [Candidatus Hydrothermarchaeaceae archaeon]